MIITTTIRTTDINSTVGGVRKHVRRMLRAECAGAHVEEGTDFGATAAAPITFIRVGPRGARHVVADLTLREGTLVLRQHVPLTYCDAYQADLRRTLEQSGASIRVNVSTQRKGF